MATLQFNKVHKNGWISYKQVGTAGAVFIDKRMVSAETLANPPATLEFDIPGLVAPGADATEKQVAAAAKKLAAEQAKAAKAEAAAAKATAKLEKLQATAAKAQAIVDAARAKAVA